MNIDNNRIGGPGGPAPLERQPSVDKQASLGLNDMKATPGEITAARSWTPSKEPADFQKTGDPALDATLSNQSGVNVSDLKNALKGDINSVSNPRQIAGSLALTSAFLSILK